MPEKYPPNTNFVYFLLFQGAFEGVFRGVSFLYGGGILFLHFSGLSYSVAGQCQWALNITMPLEIIT